MAMTVSDKSVRETLDIVRTMIDKFGPRLAGTDACRKSAADIKKRLRPLCDRVAGEEIELHPGAMWNMGRIIGGLSIIAVPFLFLGGAWVWAAAASATASIVYWIVPIVLMKPGLRFLSSRVCAASTCGA